MILYTLNNSKNTSLLKTSKQEEMDYYSSKKEEV